MPPSLLFQHCSCEQKAKTDQWAALPQQPLGIKSWPHICWNGPQHIKSHHGYILAYFSILRPPTFDSLMQKTRKCILKQFLCYWYVFLYTQTYIHVHSAICSRANTVKISCCCRAVYRTICCPTEWVKSKSDANIYTKTKKNNSWQFSKFVLFP